MPLTEIVKRQSIRHYDARPVPADVMQEIMAAARQAPTARNAQDWVLVVVDDPARRDALVDQASPHQPFLKEAPVILVACATKPEYVMRCGQPAYPIDLAIVLDHVTLEAVRHGLGTCWIGSFDEAPVKRLLGIPDAVRIVQLMSLGYPLDPRQPPPRKTAAVLFKSNQW
jgi:nitroreductase